MCDLVLIVINWHVKAAADHLCPNTIDDVPDKITVFGAGDEVAQLLTQHAAAIKITLHVELADVVLGFSGHGEVGRFNSGIKRILPAHRVNQRLKHIGFLVFFKRTQFTGTQGLESFDVVRLNAVFFQWNGELGFNRESCLGLAAFRRPKHLHVVTFGDVGFFA